jgi:Domain of unknown function (DUF4174)
MMAKAAFALAGVLAMLTAPGSAEAAKDPYLWKFRPVLVFAADSADARLRRQKSIIASQSEAMRERDIVVVYVVGGDVSHAFGPAPGGDASALRAKYGVASGAFAALLVGKDGGVKLKSSTPLPAARLTSVIDAMPMRQDEMQRKPR